MDKDGYKLAYLEENSSVAGYRTATNFFMGKHLYIDDLVTTDRNRSKGYGEKLLTWLRNLAINKGCAYLHLDPGTHRDRAHKFNFK